MSKAENIKSAIKKDIRSLIRAVEDCTSVHRYEEGVGFEFEDGSAMFVKEYELFKVVHGSDTQSFVDKIKARIKRQTEWSVYLKEHKNKRSSVLAKAS